MIPASERIKQIATKIKEKLKMDEMGNLEFSALIGVSPSTVTKWLKGDHNFTVETLTRIEDVLNIRLIDISPHRHSIKLHMLITNNQTVTIPKQLLA
jgi:transcriptional regulator with XRE-family HTH domain